MQIHREEYISSNLWNSEKNTVMLTEGIHGHVIYLGEKCGWVDGKRTTKECVCIDA